MNDIEHDQCGKLAWVLHTSVSLSLRGHAQAVCMAELCVTMCHLMSLCVTTTMCYHTMLCGPLPDLPCV
jgi:hypothetical protein